MSLQTAKSLQAERAAEQCRDLRAVLNLLIHITQSDLSGGDDDDAALGQGVAMVAPAGAAQACVCAACTLAACIPLGASCGGAAMCAYGMLARLLPPALLPDCMMCDTHLALSGRPAGHTPGPTTPAAAAAPPTPRDSPISRVVLVGLNIVLPLISAELLKFPKLAQLYYSLLSYMLEVYPKAVAELPPQHFASLMASLEWGLLGSDTVAVHCSLEGLAGLAKFQYQALQTGAPGLAGQSAGECQQRLVRDSSERRRKKTATVGMDSSGACCAGGGWHCLSWHTDSPSRSLLLCYCCARRQPLRGQPLPRAAAAPAAAGGHPPGSCGAVGGGAAAAAAI